MKNIFIACDTGSASKVNIIKKTQIKLKDYKVGYKFGLEFFIRKMGESFFKN